MQITFTHHALSQIKIRNILLENVIECIKNPDKISIDEQGNSIAQKMFSTSLLRVIFRMEGKERIVITAYRTSRIKKYE